MKNAIKSLTKKMVLVIALSTISVATAYAGPENLKELKNNDQSEPLGCLLFPICEGSSDED